MSHPKLTARFGCDAHFKVLLEIPHPNPNIFSSNLGKLENLSWREVGGGSKCPSTASMALPLNSVHIRPISVDVMTCYHISCKKGSCGRRTSIPLRRISGKIYKINKSINLGIILTVFIVQYSNEVFALTWSIKNSIDCSQLPIIKINVVQQVPYAL